MVTHPPESSSTALGRLSLECPSALEGRKIPLPLPIAEAKLGVWGRPNVGDDTLVALLEEEGVYTEPGRARREGERPPGGNGETERGGGLVPVYFFWVRVREKMACDREDWAFISVSLVRRMDVPFRMSLSNIVRKSDRDGNERPTS